jgi:hypothetical protein
VGERLRAEEWKGCFKENLARRHVDLNVCCMNRFKSFFRQKYCLPCLWIKSLVQSDVQMNFATGRNKYFVLALIRRGAVTPFISAVQSCPTWLLFDSFPTCFQEVNQEKQKGSKEGQLCKQEHMSFLFAKMPLLALLLRFPDCAPVQFNFSRS